MEALKSIAEVLDYDSNLVHASIIQTLSAKTNKESDKKALSTISKEYLKYINSNFDIIGYDGSTLERRVELLNDYYEFFYRNDNFYSLFSAQTKLRSTILEEFLYILFRDYINKKKLIILHQ